MRRISPHVALRHAPPFVMRRPSPRATLRHAPPFATRHPSSRVAPCHAAPSPRVGPRPSSRAAPRHAPRFATRRPSSRRPFAARRPSSRVAPSRRVVSHASSVASTLGAFLSTSRPRRDARFGHGDGGDGVGGRVGVGVDHASAGSSNLLTCN